MLTEPISVVRLLEVEPDVARLLTDEERAGARMLAVPVRELQKGTVEVSSVLKEEDAFGALVLDGMLMHQLRIADQPTVRLLGPGDILSLTGAPRSMLLGDASCTVTSRARLAMLGEEVLAAVQRWPRLAAGIYMRIFEQTDRLATQLAICQLPRVDQRVLSLLWLLAESWGHVGPAGTALPVSLTHDALGALIGARRPTVTLALGELSARGAIVRQESGWLLLEAPPEAGSDLPRIEAPTLIAGSAPVWSGREQHSTAVASHEELMITIGQLREEHLRNRERIRQRVVEMRNSRERCSAIRRQIAKNQ